MAISTDPKLLLTCRCWRPRPAWQDIHLQHTLYSRTLSQAEVTLGLRLRVAPPWQQPVDWDGVSPKAALLLSLLTSMMQRMDVWTDKDSSRSTCQFWIDIYHLHHFLIVGSIKSWSFGRNDFYWRRHVSKLKEYLPLTIAIMSLNTNLNPEVYMAHLKL